MEIRERFQIRGVPGNVTSTEFDGRRVDFWAPTEPNHLLVAHDGQNIFDRRTATRRQTWEMAQSGIRVSEKLGITPPLIIAVHHSRSKSDPYGRYKDLAPQGPFLGSVSVIGPALIAANEINSDNYLKLINEEIVPAITSFVDMKPTQKLTAMIGSSMGGLNTLYGLGQRPDLYGTALSFSPHWPIGGNPLVDALLNALPKPGVHKVWMSRGTKTLDGKYKPFQDYADGLMISKGWRSHHDFSSKVYPRTSHSERSWRKYLDDAMFFWLKS